MKEKITVLLIITGFSCALFHSVAFAASPYIGQEKRAIKALSDSDIEGYLTGMGMGFAKAAELNHYPGPRHVLDLSAELRLSKEQIQRTKDLYKQMQSGAIEVGKKLVKQEEVLDKHFVDQSVTPEVLLRVLQEIGALRAKLRFVHLDAHLKQKQILTRHQVMLYDQLRGYNSEKPATGSHNMDEHKTHQHSH